MNTSCPAGMYGIYKASRRPTSYPGSYLRSSPRPHARCDKTLAGAGHVAPRLWELTKKSIGGSRVRRNSLSRKNVSSKEIFHFLRKVLHFRNRQYEMETVPLLISVFIDSILDYEVPGNECQHVSRCSFIQTFRWLQKTH